MVERNSLFWLKKSILITTGSFKFNMFYTLVYGILCSRSELPGKQCKSVFLVCDNKLTSCFSLLAALGIFTRELKGSLPFILMQARNFSVTFKYKQFCLFWGLCWYNWYWIINLFIGYKWYLLTVHALVILWGVITIVSEFHCEWTCDLLKH